MTSSVLMVEVTGGWVQGRPMLGWMDGMKVAWAAEWWQWTMHKRVVSPGVYVDDWHSCGYVCMVPVFFWTALLLLWWFLTWREEGCHYMMWLGYTVKRVQLLKVKAQVLSIWAKGCMVDNYVCIIWLTWLPLDRMRKSWHIISAKSHRGIMLSMVLNMISPKSLR